MANSPNVVKAGSSRVWTIEGGPGPTRAPSYQGCMRIGDTSYGFGDITKIECPDPARYGQFVEVARAQGEKARPTFSIQARYQFQLSELLRIARKRCGLEVHVNLGECEDPQNYNAGWEKIRVYPDSIFTSWADENAGALESGDNNPTNETVESSAADTYEIKRLAFEELDPVGFVREVTAVEVCDAASCGDDCGPTSEGCSKVFFAESGTGVTPGTKPRIRYTANGGKTFGESILTSFFSNEAVDDMACVAGNLVVVSSTAGGHWANIQDILEDDEVWAETFTGFVINKLPAAITSIDASHTWLAGVGGYIYFSADPTGSVVVQNAGIATVQDLQAIHAFDADHIVAVGKANAVVWSQNDGATWAAVIGPAPAVALHTVWMHSPTTWFIGDENGKLWYTTDAGESWAQKTLPGTPTFIDHIVFSNQTVGYLSARRAGKGYIYRTLDGGYSWYILPEGSSQQPIPTNTYINQIAVCWDVNRVYGGGLNGVDGFAVVGA